MVASAMVEHDAKYLLVQQARESAASPENGVAGR